MPASRLLYIVIGIMIGAAAVGVLVDSRGASTTTITETKSLTSTLLVTTSITSTVSQVEAVCFSKPERCDRLIISLLDGAERSIHIAIFSFTSDALSEALMRAKQRGVEVMVVVEEKQTRVGGAEYGRLAAAGIEIRLDGNPDLMHHKFAVIDERIVVVGSYNWSAAAENRNDESLVVIDDPAVAERFEEEFERVWEKAA